MVKRGEAPSSPKRRRTRVVTVGSLSLGGGSPVRVQSMTKVPVEDVKKTLRQLRLMERAGCEIGRVAVPNREAVASFAAVREKTAMPLVADIHFDYRIALGAIKAGADKIRINPGNIGGSSKMKKVAEKAAAAGCAIRIGVNAGSLEKKILAAHGGATPEALVESAAAAVADLEETGFKDIVLSLKASGVGPMIKAYRLAAKRFRYPLHLGVTEAGWGLAGIVKSSVGIGSLLIDGIGDTLRVSLTASPQEEVKVAYEILASAGMRRRGVEIISCPTCGRCRFDLAGTAKSVQRRLAGVDEALTVAVMGCAVNGPGEAKAADVGLAGGKGKGIIFSRGKVLKTVSESEMIQSLSEAVFEEARRSSSEKKRQASGDASSAKRGRRC